MPRRVSAVLAIVCCGGVARAELPPAVTVGGTASCPAPAAVARALERPHPRLRVEIGSGGAVQIDVADDGARYVVRAAGGERVLVEGARRCSERATAAA